MSKTIGEIRIRVDLNSEPKDNIEDLKHKCARLMNSIPEFPANQPTFEEFERLRELALNKIEEASMLITKVVTC